MEGYAGLFLLAFLSATVLPLSSETLLAGLILAGGHDSLALWAVATAGNTLGAQVNWFLGYHLLRFREHKWFPLSGEALERARQRFIRFGWWSLLFAWLPLVGDPLTVAAGVLRVPFFWFSLLVLLGKGGRYLLLVGFL